MEQNWYNGSDLKFLVEITGDGFDMDENDWGVTVVVDGKALKRYAKEDCVKVDDSWYVCISKDVMKKFGTVSLVADAGIPDNDFDDGIRHEVDRVIVGKYSKI